MTNLAWLLVLAVLYVAGGAYLLRHPKAWLGWLLIAMGTVALFFGGLQTLQYYILRRQAAIDPNAETTRLRLTNLQQALKRYHRDMGEYPDNVAGLKALFVNPGSSHWNGPYQADPQLTDGWGLPIQYNSDRRSYQLFSSGADRRPGTSDDIVFYSPR
jgi:hypothetical protein